MGDVAQTVNAALRAERVDDILSVCPLPETAVRNDLAPIDEPYHSTQASSARVRPAASRAAVGTPFAEEAVAGESAKRIHRLSLNRSWIGYQPGEMMRCSINAGNVNCQRCGGVKVGEMSNLIGDIPPRARSCTAHCCGESDETTSSSCCSAMVIENTLNGHYPPIYGVRPFGLLVSAVSQYQIDSRRYHHLRSRLCRT